MPKENEYENETCESCVYLHPYSGEMLCGVEDHEHPKPIPDEWRCDDLTPSLECRKVRAAEQSAAALKKLASCVSSNPEDYMGLPIHRFWCSRDKGIG